jgi:polyisoprenoid-binding protein YceI
VVIAALVAVALFAGAADVIYRDVTAASQTMTLNAPERASASAEATLVDYQSLAGGWQVVGGSTAGYRVQERFAHTSADHTAVAQTSQVTGSMTLVDGGDGPEVSGAILTVALAGLRSVDQVAGYRATARDPIAAAALGVSQYPNAVFAIDEPIVLPARLPQGEPADLLVPGRLTLHGRTETVDASMRAAVEGAHLLVVAGSIETDMTDFGVSPPQRSFVTVQPAVAIDFALRLTPA